MSLVYLNNGVFEEAPNGGEYIRNKSFVVAIKDSSTNDFIYYARLVEDRGDGEYRGIDFMTKSQLQQESAHTKVVNLSGSNLYGIAGTSNSTLLSKIKAKIPKCTSIYVYALNSGDE